MGHLPRHNTTSTGSRDSMGGEYSTVPAGDLRPCATHRRVPSPPSCQSHDADPSVRRPTGRSWQTTSCLTRPAAKSCCRTRPITALPGARAPGVTLAEAPRARLAGLGPEAGFSLPAVSPVPGVPRPGAMSLTPSSGRSSTEQAKLASAVARRSQVLSAFLSAFAASDFAWLASFLASSAMLFISLFSCSHTFFSFFNSAFIRAFS